MSNDERPAAIEQNGLLAEGLTVISKCCKCGYIVECYSFEGREANTWFKKVKKYICRWCWLYSKERKQSFS